MYPSNPTNIVIKNKFGLFTESDIYNFWIKQKETILKNISDRCFFYFSTELNKSIIRRYEEKNKNILLNSYNYERKMNGHIVGVVSLFNDYSNFGIIDIDSPEEENLISSDNNFNKVKNATYEIYNYINKFYKSEIIYTGKNSFHIYVYFDLKYKLETIKKIINDKLNENKDLIEKYSFLNKRNSINVNIDLNINKKNGGYITLGSINKIGLVSIKVDIKNLLSFSREKYKIC